MAVFCVLAFTACSSVVPWRNQPAPGDEINLSFTIENNLLFLTTAAIDGRTGRYFLGTAEPRSVIDPAVASTLAAPARAGRLLQLSEKQSVRIQPVQLPLGTAGEALIGADAWGRNAVTVDYRSGLVTVQKAGIHPHYMTLWRFETAPAITIQVDGRSIAAIIDTASPDTLMLPGRSRRGTARVVMGGQDFGAIDVGYGDVTQARVGNRLLSKFLVTVDYGKRQVGLWRDPRIPMQPE